jgi:hypothetical protein
MLLFSPLGQCRVEPCDFDPNEIWTFYKHTLGQKQVNSNSNIQACHGIRSSTRRQLVHEGSNIPSMGWTVVSQTLMAHLFIIGVSVDLKHKTNVFCGCLIKIWQRG